MREKNFRQEIAGRGIFVLEANYFPDEVLQLFDITVLSSEDDRVVVGFAVLPSSKKNAASRHPARGDRWERTVDVDVRLSGLEQARHLGDGLSNDGFHLLYSVRLEFCRKIIRQWKEFFDFGGRLVAYRANMKRRCSSNRRPCQHQAVE